MTTSAISRSGAFLLKGGPVTLTSLHLQTTDLNEIATQLAATIAQSPNFFANAPVVIELNQLSSQQNLQLETLNQLLRQHGLIPVGIRCSDESVKAAAMLAGLAVFPAEQPAIKRSNSDKNELPAQNTAKAYQPTKTITQPIRSGQQIYAKDSDLLILSSVSPGAEILADGNIYIFGALRGRALAGINGNLEARIFCHSLEAELISIAGHYQISENIKKPSTQGTIHIYLENAHLCIGTL